MRRAGQLRNRLARIEAIYGGTVIPIVLCRHADETECDGTCPQVASVDTSRPQREMIKQCARWIDWTGEPSGVDHCDCPLCARGAK